MDKYRLYDKILKTKACTYYRAECQTTHDKVVVKRINRITTWEELLKSKDLALMKLSQSKYFPAIREIVKDDDQFYVILENMDKNLEYVIKTDITKQEIYKIGRLLIQMAINFSEKKVHPRQIRPVHLFVDQNLTTLKLAHFETVSKDITKLDLVQLQDLRYLSPEQVLTSKQIDERTVIFNIGLILCDLIIGKSLITANTKMNYIYELCRLFPEDKIGVIEGSEHELRPDFNSKQDNFEKIIRKYNFSSEFVALLKQMLKLDRNERLNVRDLLDAYDVVVENEKNYEIEAEKQEEEVVLEIKPNVKQFPINDQIDFELDFELQQKPTISIPPTLNKLLSDILPVQKNVQDDVTQPIIIKQSSKSNQLNKLHSTVNKLNTTKDSERRSRVTVQVHGNNYGNMLNSSNNYPSLSTLRKPQLTNYALNEANLGVKMGMNPSIFSENDL